MFVKTILLAVAFVSAVPLPFRPFRASVFPPGSAFGFSMAGLFDFERRPKASVETVRRYFSQR